MEVSSLVIPSWSVGKNNSPRRSNITFMMNKLARPRLALSARITLECWKASGSPIIPSGKIWLTLHEETHWTSVSLASLSLSRIFNPKTYIWKARIRYRTLRYRTVTKVFFALDFVSYFEWISDSWIKGALTSKDTVFRRPYAKQGPSPERPVHWLEKMSVELSGRRI